MEVWHYPSHGLLKLKGSLPYFLNGHNFSFSKAEFVESIDIADSLLGNIGLWGSIVDTFENGVIIPVEEKPKEYIARHYATSSAHLKRVHNEKYSGKFEMWQKVGEDIKLYDAVANIKMKQGMARREVIESAGWNPALNYLKCEIRYTKPSLLTNKHLMLEKLQNESFMDFLKSNLMDQYHLLSPMKTLIIPSDKKNFKSLDAVIFTLAETMLNGLGLPLDMVKKQIYSTINQAECLSKSDKDARKAQIRKAFDKLEESPSSKWDLTNKIASALDADI